MKPIRFKPLLATTGNGSMPPAQQEERRLRKRARTALWFTALLALAGCGGGDDGGPVTAPAAPAPTVPALTAPAAPALTLSVGLKQLQFAWNAVAGAMHYRLFENPDGVSGYTQVGGNLTATSHTRDLAVHRHQWANARYLVEACNSAGCSTASNEVVTFGAVLQAIGYIKASNTSDYDEFGYSVALSVDGNTLAVGARLEDSNAIGIGGNQLDNSAANAGAVYVYTRSAGTWTQQAYVKASNTGAGDWFGSSVALSADGNTLAVGAIGEDSNATGINGDEANNLAAIAGAVYVYIRSGDVWRQQAYVKASNTGAGDWFGSSVALSADGNTLAVGARYEASNARGIGGSQIDNSAAIAGAVYVYARSVSTWTQHAYAKASNTDAGDEFGSSVALSGNGNTLAVGTRLEDSNAIGIGGNQLDNSAADTGAVYLY